MTGKQLRQWRTESNLSQLAAAQQLGVGRASIQNWEKSADAEIPQWAALAIAAVTNHLKPYKPS